MAAKHSTASRPRLGQRRSARTQDPTVGTRSKSCGACSRGQGTGEERRRKVKARARTGAGNTRGLRTKAKTPPFPLPSTALDCINEKGQPAFPFQFVFSLFSFLAQPPHVARLSSLVAFHAFSFPRIFLLETRARGAGPTAHKTARRASRPSSKKGTFFFFRLFRKCAFLTAQGQLRRCTQPRPACSNRSPLRCFIS